ncbi:MAG: dehydrogenase [Planctomycetaceae bacterium]|nr:dehydrogenase [Planctomycetaceae bacterium]
MRIALTTLLLCLIASTQSTAADWLQWRGPNGNNVAASGQRVPTSWSSSQNVVWKTNVPGRGHSSPIIVGDLIVLTTATGQSQSVVAFDRGSGDKKWETPISQGGFPRVHNKNTHASATACSDGKQVYATFNHHDKIEAVALSLAGKVAWKRDVGRFSPRQYQYGYAASPTLYKGKLIISGDADTGAWIKALDTRSGRVDWEQNRPTKLNWASPIVAKVAGQDQLLISGCEMIASYDPASGRPLWNQRCLTMATCGTVVWDNDTVYASGGYPKKQTVAVKADGSRQIRWANGVKCYEQSMLIHDGHIYALDDGGVAYCWHAKSGQEKWRQRLGGPVSASPLLVGDTIYASNERGTTYVYKANSSRYQEVSRNQLGNSSFASPVVVDNRMYLRVASGRQEALYAIGTN